MRIAAGLSLILTGALALRAPSFAADTPGSVKETTPDSSVTDTPPATSPAPAPTETTPLQAPPDRSHAKLTEADSGPELLEPDTELIDIPTAGVVDYGGYSTRTRFFSNGGVVEWLNFGVFQRLNIGGSLNVDNLLGTGSPVHVVTPDLQVKFRFYDGDRLIPAFAIGYDGQGYLYNHPGKLYNERQRGLYLVGTQEIGLPGLMAHAGANISDFNSNSIFGFVAMSYNIRDKVQLMSEWDNINTIDNSRVNLGFRVYVTPVFNIDFAVRSVGQGGHFSDGVSRGPERVVMLKYTGNF